MTNKIKYDIFISHSFKDKDWVIEFDKQLSNSGFSVFIFEKSIKAGESISIKINQVLEECKYVILVMTQDWVDSEWSKIEVFSTLFTDPNNNKQKVIPLLLKPCNIPFILKPLRYLDFQDELKFYENLKLIEFELIDLLEDKFIKNSHLVQTERILSQSMLPWTIHGGPSVGFIIPELFIEPKIKPIKNPIVASRINHWLASYKWDKNIAVVGLPGIGKSTLLKKIFIEYGSYQEKLQLTFIPIFISVRDLFDFSNSGISTFPEYFFSKSNIILSEHFKLRILYLIDGLDEIDVTSSSKVIEIINQIMSKDDLVWIASRKEFFFNRLKTNSNFYSLFYDVLEIQEWDIETDSLKFALDYSKKYNDDEIYSLLLKIRENSPTIDNFLKKPFELTLILFLLSGNESISTKIFDSSYTLYKAFYENWLQREQYRETSKLDNETLRKLHKIVAIALYNNKGNGIKLSSIEESVIDLDTKLISLKNDSSFWDLFITSSKNKEDTIERFWHETFGEFLLAEELIQSFCSSTQNFLDNLKTIYNHEINLFIREGFQQLNDYQKQIINSKLAKTYLSEFTIESPLELESISLTSVKTLNILPESINNSDNSIRIREQIIYYLGRLELNYYPPILSFASTFETNLLLKRSASLGGILYKNEELEKNYINLLIPNSIEDKLNRSVQLVYFSDTLGDIHSFNDNGIFSWEKTRTAIFKRLKQNSNRDLALRWWDLRTLYCFFESRKWQDKIFYDDFKGIEQSICESNQFSKERNSQVANEVSRILTSLQENNCIINN